MKTARHSILMLILLLAVGLFAGCSDEATDITANDNALTGTDDYEGLDFSQPYGGLTMSDEPEGFGDEALKQMMYSAEDEMVEDDYANDADVLQLEEMGENPVDPADPNRPRFTFLRLRWGMIHGPDDSLSIPEDGCGLTNWTGDLHTDRGIVLVRRVIAFERPYDHLIRPRLNRQTVAFVSHTACHYDGLLIQIIELPGQYDQADMEPNMLHITTPGFTGSFAVAELAETDEVFEVDNVGNVFQMTGFTLSDTDYCPKGFLSGRFRTLPSDESDPTLTGEDRLGEQLGTFAGLYFTLNGRGHGFLRGGYGLDEEGNRIFYGKYISRLGHFRGLLVGTWEPAEDETMMATFFGRWVNAGGTVEGVLGGNAHPVGGYPGGFFAGRWTTLCDDEAEDGIN